MNSHINAKDLYEASKKGCIKNCKECQLNVNGKCLLKVRKGWEAWTMKQKEKYAIKLEELKSEVKENL